jgi:hypothetical protein
VYKTLCYLVRDTPPTRHGAPGKAVLPTSLKPSEHPQPHREGDATQQESTRDQGGRTLRIPALLLRSYTS